MPPPDSIAQLVCKLRAELPQQVLDKAREILRKAKAKFAPGTFGKVGFESAATERWPRVLCASTPDLCRSTSQPMDASFFSTCYSHAL
jgi:hypothetical protein